MRNLLLATALTAAFGAVNAQGATLTLEVFDNATMVGTVTSNTGTLNFTNDTAPGFASIVIDVAGSPILPFGDLSTTTLDVSSAPSATSHTLTIDVFQTGLSVAEGPLTESSFSVNHLAGAATMGPTVESTFFGGSGTALGTQLASHVFPIGTVSEGVGPFAVTAGSTFFSDAQQYVIPFAPHLGAQSANDTIELTTGIPEPSTWALMAIGFGALVWTAWRRNNGGAKTLAA